jgi:hypothetical protein
MCYNHVKIAQREYSYTDGNRYYLSNAKSFYLCTRLILNLQIL